MLIICSSTDIHATFAGLELILIVPLTRGSFIRNAGGIGDTVLAEGIVDSLGRTLAYTTVRLSHPETGKLLAHGTHTKFIADALKSPKNVTFDVEGENERPR